MYENFIQQDEQFIEKEKYIVNCPSCEYYKRIKQRENVKRLTNKTYEYIMKL